MCSIYAVVLVYFTLTTFHISHKLQVVIVKMVKMMMNYCHV